MIEIDISKGVEVGGIHIEIDVSENAGRELISKDCYGDHSSYLSRIRIDQTLPTDKFTNTFLHECLEAINVHYCNNKVKHDEITNIANGLSQVLKSIGVQFVVKVS